MNTYVILIRGINVGGKNIVPMMGLRKCLEEQGFCECFDVYRQWKCNLKF